MPPTHTDSRPTILAAAERLLRKRGEGTPTLEAVAREARCAKGLINYHFSSKADVLAAVAAELGSARAARWAGAFAGRSADSAIRETWDLLVAERHDGTFSAWAALRAERGRVTVQAVNSHTSSFARSLSKGVSDLLASLDLRPTVAVPELGWYLAAVVQGMEVLLEAGAEPDELQGAYAAAWLGILSLTRAA
jgi:AcrR family transcriptional regulator